MVKLEGTIEERPEPGAWSHENLAVRTLTTEAPDYDAARQWLVSELPGGWRLIAFRRL